MVEILTGNNALDPALGLERILQAANHDTYPPWEMAESTSASRRIITDDGKGGLIARGVYTPDELTSAFTVRDVAGGDGGSWTVPFSPVDGSDQMYKSHFNGHKAHAGGFHPEFDVVFNNEGLVFFYELGPDGRRKSRHDFSNVWQMVVPLPDRRAGAYLDYQHQCCYANTTIARSWCA